MIWMLLGALAIALGLTLFALAARRRELRAMQSTLAEQRRATEGGAAKAQLQFPVVDLSRCLGCATCVAVCPEDGVLGLVHGQAQVVNGARCQGIAACERECPVDAITVTLADVETREDIPAVAEHGEVVGTPGLFLAGEVTAHGLIRVAVEHGTMAAREVAARREARVGVAVAHGRTEQGLALHPGPDDQPLDLLIVGAGPGGLAAALEARRLGLRFRVLEQEPQLGGTVARYPRGKLVLTEPVDLPLHGRMRRRTWSKEELIDLWTGLASEHELPIDCGRTFTALEADPAGGFAVHTDAGEVHHAQNVCLAIGRRGSPRRLGVPGEDRAEVAYELRDASEHRGERCVVVGGGDSAVETAVALARQPGTTVTLVHRGSSFVRTRAKNEAALRAAVADGSIALHTDAQVVEVRDGFATVLHRDNQSFEIEQDRVFVQVGGVPPFDLLKRAGVSFDPAHRQLPPERARRAGTPGEERGTGFAAALWTGFALCLATLAFAAWHADYYALPLAARPTHTAHDLLRPGMGLGLAFGITSAALIVANLAYLLRRASVAGFRFGSLGAWMNVHVATGLLAFLLTLLHAAMAPRDTSGGHAFWALLILLGTGAVGRYLYAWLPRAANGRELKLEEIRQRLGTEREAFAGVPAELRAAARGAIDRLGASEQWQSGFVGRFTALFRSQSALRHELDALAARAREHGLGAVETTAIRRLVRDAHRTALAAAHLEDLRAVLFTWRWLHRWVAALMVVLLVVHVIHALTYGSYFGGLAAGAVR